MKNLIKFKVIILAFSIILTSQSVAADLILPKPKPEIDKETKITTAKKNGANSVTAIATHALLSGPAIDRIKDSNINQLVVTDTVSISDEKKLDNMKIVTVSNIFAEAIARIHSSESVSSLFEF